MLAIWFLFSQVMPRSYASGKNSRIITDLQLELSTVRTQQRDCVKYLDANSKNKLFKYGFYILTQVIMSPRDFMVPWYKYSTTSGLGCISWLRSDQ